jgi:hypothetical protein
MKPSSWIILTSLVVLVAAMSYLNRQRVSPVPTPVPGPASETQNTRPLRMDVPIEEPLQPAPQSSEGSTQPSVAIPVASDTASDSAAIPVPHSTPFSRAIDTLVSPQASFQQKHEAWRQLRDAGQLDEVIVALKEGAADNPNSAAYPAALGQAQLYKAGEVAWSGGTISEMGMLGMQADQNFDHALTLDPANWEAQFFKAVAMSHWPLELNKGEEVVQRLSSLIDQQDTLTPQPQFAQTYVVLGDQYQKMGEPDYALATWQIGAQKFPSDPALQQKIRGN